MSANSLTMTMARRSAQVSHFLKSQDVWPEPLESIDLRVPALVKKDRSRFQLIEYFFWAVKGPALAAYSSIEGKIKTCLSHRDDLFEGENESAVPSCIDCYMFGPTPETARPCITFSCQSKGYCQNVITAIKESDFWDSFRKEHPGFKLVHLRDRPRPVRMATFHHDDIAVYTPDRLTLQFGAPLFFLGPSERVHKDGGRRPDATLGGIVYLDDKPYGLTIAHALRSKVGRDNTGSVDDEGWDTGSTFSVIDDSDDEPACQSDIGASVRFAPPVNSHATSERESSRDIILQEVEPHQPPVPFLGLLHLVGKVTHCSEGSPSDELDWALVDFAEGWDVFEGFFTLQVVQDHLEPGCAKRVYTVDWHGNFIEGTLKANNSLIGLKDSRELLSLHCVMLERPIFLGSCGMWILDFDGNWYGHIVAGHPGSNVVYIAPAQKIQRAIEESTEKRMRVAHLMTRMSRLPFFDTMKSQVEASNASDFQEQVTSAKATTEKAHKYSQEGPDLRRQSSSESIGMPIRQPTFKDSATGEDDETQSTTGPNRGPELSSTHLAGAKKERDNADSSSDIDDESVSMVSRKRKMPQLKPQVKPPRQPSSVYKESVESKRDSLQQYWFCCECYNGPMKSTFEYCLECHRMRCGRCRTEFRAVRHRSH